MSENKIASYISKQFIQRKARKITMKRVNYMHILTVHSPL
ncbi:hypothetical protein HMPREF0023_1075 [Acinetobacter sp. ATCC 27244]|nr:hypothetical protein HMPREF0023_1075 [Acinetobacter sp. ATCC 27244]